MGGEGSGRKPDITNQLLKKQEPVIVSGQIASSGYGENIVIPNFSGFAESIHGHSISSQFVLKTGDTMSGVLLITADNSTADSAYVPMVLYNTDATPPTASTVPIGTIYLQYTP